MTWADNRAIAIATSYREEGLAPFGDAPLEYLTGEALATRGICDALLELIGACPDADGRGMLARLVAERVVAETLKAEGSSLVQMMRLLLDYTEGTPVHRVPSIPTGESVERVVTITRRADGYVRD